MTLEEAIKHAEEVANNKCNECGQEHRQLAEWLKDYKRLLEQEPILEKIRAEIEQRPYGIANDSVIRGMQYERAEILEIIDKYRK